MLWAWLLLLFDVANGINVYVIKWKEGNRRALSVRVMREGDDDACVVIYDGVTDCLNKRQ